jgi:hypothetical protein
MPFYKERVVTGEVTSYRRADKIELLNVIPPEVHCYVSDRVTYPTGETVDRNLTRIDFQMLDPTEQIPIINPVDYEPTAQTFPAGQFHLMAASVALWLMRENEVLLATKPLDPVIIPPRPPKLA